MSIGPAPRCCHPYCPAALFWAPTCFMLPIPCMHPTHGDVVRQRRCQMASISHLPCFSLETPQYSRREYRQRSQVSDHDTASHRNCSKASLRLQGYMYVVPCGGGNVRGSRLGNGACMSSTKVKSSLVHSLSQIGPLPQQLHRVRPLRFAGNAVSIKTVPYQLRVSTIGPEQWALRMCTRNSDSKKVLP